jgi:hypothetical protein
MQLSCQDLDHHSEGHLQVSINSRDGVSTDFKGKFGAKDPQHHQQLHEYFFILSDCEGKFKEYFEYKLRENVISYYRIFYDLEVKNGDHTHHSYEERGIFMLIVSFAVLYLSLSAYLGFKVFWFWR